MTTNDTTTLTVKDLHILANERGEELHHSHYRGYVLLFSPRTGDVFICDAKTEEQVDVTGLGVDGAKLYIDQWVDTAP